MGLLRLWLSCLALLLGLSATDAAQPAQTSGRTHVYLMRGIFNLSSGLDALAGKLGRMGIAASVHAHSDGDTVADEMIRDYKRGRVRSIVLIGHSLGAGAVVSIAHKLNEARIPVALLIALDPVVSLSVSSNVRRAVNFYVAGTGRPVDKDPGFRGSLKNLDVSAEPDMGHMAVQSSEKMHARMIDHVRGALGGANAPSPTASPAAKKDGQGAALKLPGGA